MSDIIPPTKEELSEARWDSSYGLTSVHRELDDSWRHGNYVLQVFHRHSDDTYWSVRYQRSGDGEYDSLRENEMGYIKRVYPKTETIAITKYVEE